MQSAGKVKTMHRLPSLYILCGYTALNTVQTVLSDRSNIDKTKNLMTNGKLMKVESTADCSPWSILQYF